MARIFPTSHQEKRPPKGPSTEVEARAGVEPTYTDLQSERAHGAHGAPEVGELRAGRLERAKRALLAKIFPTAVAALLTACGGGDPDPEDDRKAIPVEPAASAAR